MTTETVSQNTETPPNRADLARRLRALADAFEVDDEPTDPSACDVSADAVALAAALVETAAAHALWVARWANDDMESACSEAVTAALAAARPVLEDLVRDVRWALMVDMEAG